MAAVQEAVSNPESAVAGRDPAEILTMLGDRPWPEKFLDLMLRLGHRGDGFGANPDGLSLAQLEANPHGIDFGPLRAPTAPRSSSRPRARSTSSPTRSQPTFPGSSIRSAGPRAKNSC